MYGSILLNAMRMSSLGLRRLQALVSMTVRAENPYSCRHVVANGRRKAMAALPIINFSFFKEVENSPSDAVDKSCQ